MVYDYLIGLHPGRPLWPTGTTRAHEILATAATVEARSHIMATFRGVAAVRFLPSLAAFESERDVEEPLLGLLYCDGHDEVADRDWLPTIQRFGERWASVPLVAYAPLTAIGMRQCWNAGTAGVGTLVIRGHDTLLQVLAPVMERRAAQPILRDIHAEFFGAQAQAGDAAWRVMRHCLTHVRDGLTVERLADAIDVSPRTVATILAGASWPSPERLIMYARLLVFAWLLRDGQCSVNHAAAILGVEAGSLRHLAARYLGHPAEWLRGPDGIAHVVAAMRHGPVCWLDLPAAGSVLRLPAESLPQAVARLHSL